MYAHYLVLSFAFLFGSSELLAAPAPDKKPSDKVIALQKERLKTLDEMFTGHWERVKVGKEPVATILSLMVELTDARLELADTEAEALKALKTSLDLHRDVEDAVNKMVEAGLMTKSQAGAARAARLKVEIQIEKRNTR